MIQFKKTKKRVTCEEHGDGVYVIVDGTHITRIRVCDSCLNEAINGYLEQMKCTDCGASIGHGWGIQRDGVLTPLCRDCQVKRVFNYVREH